MHENPEGCKQKSITEGDSHGFLLVSVKVLNKYKLFYISYSKIFHFCDMIITVNRSYSCT